MRNHHRPKACEGPCQESSCLSSSALNHLMKMEMIIAKGRLVPEEGQGGE